MTRPMSEVGSYARPSVDPLVKLSGGERYKSSAQVHDVKENLYDNAVLQKVSEPAGTVAESIAKLICRAGKKSRPLEPDLTIEECADGKEYWLHYIGAGLYTVKTFEAEAYRYGVARAMPLSIIKSMNWGDVVLLAFRERDGEDESEVAVARVFGCFRVVGINHNLPPELAKELKEQLKVVGESSGGGTVHRRCGSYGVGGTVYVADTLPELIEKLEKVCREHGFRPKVFVGGEYRPLQPFTVRVPFTRSALRIRLPIDPVESRPRIDKAAVVRIYNYKRRRYMPKRARKAPQLTLYL